MATSTSAANAPSSSSGSNASSPKPGKFLENCEADDELAFTCEEPHIMAIYNFASTVAFEFRFDKAKDMIVSTLPSFVKF